MTSNVTSKNDFSIENNFINELNINNNNNNINNKSIDKSELS